MHFEEAMRERHAFEDRVRTFLEVVSVMTDREIEIALARLLDTLNATSDDTDRANASIKGELLKSYIELRRQGARSQRKMKRTLLRLPSDLRFPLPSRKADFSGREDWSDYLLRCTAEIRLLQAEQIPLSPSGTPSTPIELVKLLSP